MTLTEGDRRQVERFAAFLRITEGADRDDHGCRLVTDETKRYAFGEDVDPVAADRTHPAVWSLRGPARATRASGEDCPHLSSTGVDHYFGPGKVMACDVCGHREEVDW